MSGSLEDGGPPSIPCGQPVTIVFCSIVSTLVALILIQICIIRLFLFLFSEAGEEYLPASQFVLQVLESSDAKSVLSSTFSDNSLKMLAEDAKIMVSF